jgi:hypothetical protein
MSAQRNDRRGNLIPVLIAVIVAVVAQTAILLDDFGASNNSRDSGNAKMITAAAVSRAGAIEIPSDATAGQPVSF